MKERELGGWAAICLAIALIAAAIGFSSLAIGIVGAIGKLVFLAAMILFVIAALFLLFRRESSRLE